MKSNDWSGHWRHTLLAILFACIATPAHAGGSAPEDDDSSNRSFPLVVSLMQEAIGLPFTPQILTGPIHPGLSVGSEYEYLHGRYGRLFQTANLGYFHHARFDRLAYLNSELGYAYHLGFGLGFESLLGLGYGHSFAARQLYSLETGEAARDWGHPSMLVSLGLGVDYDLRAKDLLPMSIFLRYQPLVQLKFNPNNSMPIMPRTILFVGARIHFDGRGN